MARIHDATLTPSKIELVAPWLATQTWFTDDPDAVQVVGAYRFDDPEGEVGLETLLLRAPSENSKLWQVPLSYRGAPLADGEAFLVGTMQHSALGDRWVYNAIGDPVYRMELARVIARAGTEVPKFLETPEGPVELALDTRVQGSGTADQAVPEFWAAEATEAASAEDAAMIDTGLARLFVTRRVGGAALGRVLGAHAAGRLTGTWPRQEEPLPLAALELGPRG